MAHEETVMELMNQLVIADKHIIGDLMAHKGIWTAGTSAVNNSYKILTNSDLERGDGWFRIKGCQSEYKEHARLLTKALAEILKLNLTTKIFREPTLKDVGLRPDSLILLNKNNLHLCFILEVCNNEFPEFLQQKINAWSQWGGALETLSRLFETKAMIQAFDIVVSGDISAEGAFEFKNYIEEVKK